MTNAPNPGQKLTFRIVDFSGEDPQYPVTELLSGSPQSKGWQSQRFCDWPQSITFQFFGPVRLKQLQFLSHQCKISSKIELFTAMPNLRSPAPDPDLKFKKLGYLSLDSNERSGYQSRELKTVYIDSVCLYLKIVLQKCHLNKFNLFNQVGLIAVGIFGDPVSNVAPSKEMDPQKAKYDRLEYETQFDAMTVQKMKELEDAKTKAIEREDFDEAKKIKQAIERMKHLGAQLQHLEESKAKAIKNEDYDSAKIIKQEIERLREAIAPSSLGRQYTREDRPQQRVQFSDDEPMNPGHRTNSPDRRQGGFRQDEDEGRNRINSQDRNNREEFKQGQDHRLPVDQKPRRSHNQDHPPSYEDRQVYNAVAHDEQVIPAMLNKKQQEPLDEEGPPVGAQGGSSQEAEPLTAQNQKLADPLIPVIGEELARKIFSKVWNLREEGLKILEGELNGKGHEINKSDPGAVFVALMGCVAHTINDKVNQVVLKSISLLQALVAQHPNIGSKNELMSYIDGALTGLLEKLGDNNARVRENAEKALMGMANNPVVTCSFCVNALTKNVNPTKHKTAGSTKHIVGRLNILRTLVKEFKINSKDVPYQPVVTYAIDKLENSAPEVRATASSLLVDIYKQVGERLKGDLEGVRPNQLELLMKEFDAVAGGPRGGYEEEEEKKPIVTTNINAQGAKKGAAKPKETGKPKPAPADEGPACEFCGRTDKNLADPKKMDIHLWKECPMLATCEHCAQIEEISQLNKHMLEECDNKKAVRKCPRCKEAVHMDEYKQHTEEMSCQVQQPPSKANRCPLCHQDIPPGDLGWRKHLLNDGCPNNERTI